MRLAKLSIKNYKSLREVEIVPNDFSVLIGRNSSGKSNFADALEFLSIAYADGLEHAVAKKGGYENIAHRKERRSRSAISFSIELKANLKESEIFPPRADREWQKADPSTNMTFRHCFEFRRKQRKQGSEYLFPLAENRGQSTFSRWLIVPRGLPGLPGVTLLASWASMAA